MTKETLMNRRNLLTLCLILTAGLSAAPALAGELSLAWTGPETGPGETMLLESTPTGPEVRATMKGLVFAAMGQPWVVRDKVFPVSHVDCACAWKVAGDDYDPDNPPKKCLRTVKMKGVELFAPATGKVIPVGKPALLFGGEEGGGTWEVEVLGQAGSVVFFADRTWNHTCGAAHGNATAEFIAIDVAKGRAIRPWTDSEEIELLRLGHRAAFQTIADAVRRDDPERKMEADDASQLTLQAMTPRWNAEGLLVPQYLFQIEWDYASSDGTWGDYSRSAWVPLETIPAALSTGTRQPPLVRDWFAKHAYKAERRGASIVDEIARNAVLKLFGKRLPPPDASLDTRVRPKTDDVPAKRPSRPGAGRPGR
jgi:hypothetical protein